MGWLYLLLQIILVLLLPVLGSLPPPDRAGTLEKTSSTNSITKLTPQTGRYKDPTKSCYQLYEVTCCDDQLNQFPADSLEQCEQYCQFSDHCNYLVYKTQTKMCTLVKNLPAKTKNVWSTIGNFTCVRSVRGALEQQNHSTVEWFIMVDGKKQLEVLITNGDTGKCLGVDKTSHLKWGACLDMSLWIVRLMNPNSAVDVSIKHKISGKCMEVLQDGFTVTAVNLTNCSRSDAQQQLVISPFNILPTHTMEKQLLEELLWTLQLNYDYKTVHLCLHCKETLQNLVIDPVEEFRGACNKDMDPMKIKNGKVVKNPSAPFYLPGSNMTVACNPGYEAREHNNATTYQYTCLNSFIKPLPCQGLENTAFSYRFATNMGHGILFPTLFLLNILF